LILQFFTWEKDVNGQRKNWIIIVGDRSIHDIAKDLAEAGLKDIQTFQEIGSITGSADDETVSRLRKVRG